MKVLQLVALWTATVALVVIAVFTTLNYFDADSAEEPTPRSEPSWVPPVSGKRYYNEPT